MEFLYQEYGLLGLFILSFLAASVLPLSSEVALGAMILSGFDVPSVFLTATIGNSLGSMSGYLLGYIGDFNKMLKMLKIDETKAKKYEAKVRKYGIWCALFAWLPIIGDIFPFILGFLKASWIQTLILVIIGKALRYAVVIYGISFF